MEINITEFGKKFDESIRNFDRLYEEYARAKGLSYVSLVVLEIICVQKDFCTQKTICLETHYPKQSVNAAVKGFFEKGYIRLEEIPKDRRNKKISLTEKGEEYVKEIILPFWQSQEKAEDTFSQADKEIFLKMIDEYINRFEDLVKKEDKE